MISFFFWLCYSRIRKEAIMEEEVWKQLDTIKKQLDDLPLMKEIQRAKRDVYADQKLMEHLDLFHQNPYQTKIKQEIYQSPKFVNFKHLENELYYFTLEINQRLNRLTEGKRCK